MRCCLRRPDQGVARKSKAGRRRAGKKAGRRRRSWARLRLTSQSEPLPPSQGPGGGDGSGEMGGPG